MKRRPEAAYILFCKLDRKIDEWNIGEVMIMEVGEEWFCVDRNTCNIIRKQGFLNMIFTGHIEGKKD